MITGIKKKNKLTEIWFDETDSAVNIRTYNTDLKNRLPDLRDRPPTILRPADRPLFRGQAQEGKGNDDCR